MLLVLLRSFIIKLISTKFCMTRPIRHADTADCRPQPAVLTTVLLYHVSIVNTYAVTASSIYRVNLCGGMSSTKLDLSSHKQLETFTSQRAPGTHLYSPLVPLLNVVYVATETDIWSLLRAIRSISTCPQAPKQLPNLLYALSGWIETRRKKASTEAFQSTQALLSDAEKVEVSVFVDACLLCSHIPLPVS